MLKSKTSGNSLLIGSFLLFITMLLHPGHGGGLTQGFFFAVFAHSLAILSLPFCAIGFIGLAQKLSKLQLLSYLALAIMITGLIAALIAAAVNGLLLPLLTNGMSHSEMDAYKELFNYNRALNHSFDYILISAMFLSTSIWSLCIYKTKEMPRWIAFLGFALFLSGLSLIFSGFYFLNVGGFRTIIYGWAIWIVASGISLRKSKS